MVVGELGLDHRIVRGIDVVKILPGQLRFVRFVLSRRP